MLNCCTQDVARLTLMYSGGFFCCCCIEISWLWLSSVLISQMLLLLQFNVHMATSPRSDAYTHWLHCWSFFSFLKKRADQRQHLLHLVTVWLCSHNGNFQISSTDYLHTPLLSQTSSFLKLYIPLQCYPLFTFLCRFVLILRASSSHPDSHRSPCHTFLSRRKTPIFWRPRRATQLHDPEDER